MMIPEKAKNIYWGASPLPTGAKSLGEYTDDRRSGCLMELASGVRVVGNAGVIQTIPRCRPMTAAQFSANRARLGLSKSDLGRLMGIPYRHVWRIEERSGPTHQQAAMVRALLLIHRHGLLGRLMAEVKAD